MKRLVMIALAMVLVSAATAQDKPFRAGVKLGFPNIVGVNVEYVTPLLGGKLAPSADFSTFSLSSGDTELDYTYFELGANYYFINEGKGLYGNLSYGNIGMDATVTDPVLGVGQGDLSISLVNLKVGAKLGGTFYFRPEVGFGLPFGETELEATYTDPITGSTTSQDEDVPIKPGLVANIGIGLAF